MKTVKLHSTLFLSLVILLFTACGNDEANNDIYDDETTDEEFQTRIEGDVPPAMIFYEVNMTPDRKSVESLSENTFMISADQGVYWAEWEYADELDSEEIYAIIEKTAGHAYELQTTTLHGEGASYVITKLNDEGIWTMTNSENDHVGYLCDMDAADFYAKESNVGNAEDTPEEIVARLGNKWIELTKEGEEWIIYNECRYGSGGMYLDETGSWIEFSGGGDADSKDIVEMIRIDYNKIKVTFREDVIGVNPIITLTSTGEDMLIMDEGTDNERAFILSSASDLVRTVNEECDEEDL